MSLTIRALGHAAENITPGSIAYNPVVGIMVYCLGSRVGKLRVTGDPNVYGDPNQIVVCIWYGIVGFHAKLGRTVVHGVTITTGTINASKIQAYTITAEQLSATEAHYLNRSDCRWNYHESHDWAGSN